jgi:hypothetical protein
VTPSPVPLPQIAVQIAPGRSQPVAAAPTSRYDPGHCTDHDTPDPDHPDHPDLLPFDSVDPADLECPGCGCAFVSPAVFGLHRAADGRCLPPPEVGLTVAPLHRLTWALPAPERELAEYARTYQ